MSTSIDPLSASGAGAAAPAPSSSSASAQSPLSRQATLSRDDFYRIMISELSNQDPFEPMDNREFLDQLATLQSLDTTARLGDGIEKLVFQNQMASASNFLGREVTAPRLTLGPDGNLVVDEVKGKVERVLVRNGAVELVLDGDRSVKLEQVVEVA